MACQYCGKPVVLVPSAAERSRKYGDHPPSYYRALFTNHYECEVRNRSEQAIEAMRKTR